MRSSAKQGPWCPQFALDKSMTFVVDKGNILRYYDDIDPSKNLQLCDELASS